MPDTDPLDLRVPANLTTWEICGHCDGFGYMKDEGHQPCPYCGGAGEREIEHGDCEDDDATD